jgi:hypothetical protein
MAPREGSSIAPQGGVVDERLNVHGVKGLKVCDLSICPDNVGCNTFSVSLCPFVNIITMLSVMKHIDCATYWREVCHACGRGLGILWCRFGHEGTNLPCPRRILSSFSSLNNFVLGLYMMFRGHIRFYGGASLNNNHDHTPFWPLVVSLVVNTES